MSRYARFLLGFFGMLIFLVGFFAFVSWGESPATWDPVNRFVVAVMAYVLSIGMGLVCADSRWWQ